MHYETDYNSIIELCSVGNDIPEIGNEITKEILRKIHPDVNDYNSVTANHFLHAGEEGVHHFHLLITALIEDINNIAVDE